MDRRGCGLSDPRSEAVSLEDEARDVLAVLDAAGSERAVLMGYTTGGPLAIPTAALAPERVQAIVLYASMARAVADDDVDWTYDDEGRRAMWAQLAEVWGTGAQPRADRPLARRRPAHEGLDGAHGAPVLEPGRAACASWAPSASRTSARLLGELRVPTLILHRTGGPHDRRAPLALSRRADPGRALRRARGRRQPPGRGRQLGHARRDRGVPHRRALAHRRARRC